MPDPYSSDRWTMMFVVTPNDGALIGVPKEVGGKPYRYISGFMVDINGTIEIVTKEGSLAPVTLTVLAGVQYHIACSQVLAAGGGVTTVFGAL